MKKERKATEQISKVEREIRNVERGKNEEGRQHPEGEIITES
jgi:hypothetical protein